MKLMTRISRNVIAVFRDIRPAGKTCLAMLLALALPDLADSQQPPRSVKHDSALGVPAAPNSPTLLAPANNHQINAVSGIPTQIFTWDPPAGGAVVVFYRFQFENADDPTWTGSAPKRIDATGGRISTEQIIPPALANVRIRWSVRACNDSPVISVIGGPGGNCGSPATRILTWSAQAQPPRLTRPPAGAAHFPNEQFTWSTAAGANAYLFCISKPGVACPTNEVSNANTLVVRRTGNSNTVAAPDTSRFLGQTMNWTVAACGGSGSCSYQQNVRPVFIGGEPPVLTSPANGATVRSLNGFEWAPVSWATYYLLCVSAPGVACPDDVKDTGGPSPLGPLGRASRPDSSTAQTHVYQSFDERSSHYVDLAPMEGERRWTVAACSRQLDYCRYQSNVRSIRIQPRWDVSARVTRVQVHDRCDNISPGDWNLSLFLTAPSKSRSRRWPGQRGSRNVNDGDAIATPELRDRLRTSVSGLGDNETVTLAMTGVDCDSEGVWTLANVFSGVEGAISVVRNWTVQCGGEEVHEVTFGNDGLGELTHSVRLADHLTAGSFSEKAAVRSGPGDCGKGPGAYTATFEMSGERR